MADGARGAPARGPAAAVALACVLVPLGSTSLAVALGQVAEDLRVDAATATWAVTGYLLAMLVAQPLGGRLGDRVGHRRLLLGGVTVFGAASVLAAAAPTLAVLCAARVVQALAGAAIVPNGMALLRAADDDRLGRRLGGLAAAMGIAAAAGPPLGALLLATGDWRAIFLANLPVVALALVAGRRDLPGPVRAAPAPPAPCTPAPARARRGVLAATAGIAGSTLVLYALLIAAPLVLAAQGWDAPAAALLCGLLPLASLVVSLPAGRVADAAGRRLPAVAGAALVVAALVPLAAGAATAAVPLAAALVAAGAGIGVAGPALQAAVLDAAGERDAGALAGWAASARYAGAIAGTVLVAAALAAGDGAAAGGLGAAFAACLAAAVAALAAALVLPAGRAHARRTRGLAATGYAPPYQMVQVVPTRRGRPDRHPL